MIEREEKQTTGSKFDSLSWTSKFTFAYLWPLRRLTSDLISGASNLKGAQFDRFAPQKSAANRAGIELASNWRLQQVAAARQKKESATNGKREPRASLARAIMRTYGIQLIATSSICLLADVIFDSFYFIFSVRLINSISHYPVISSEPATNSTAARLDLDSQSSCKMMESLGQARSELIFNAAGCILAGLFTSALLHPFMWRMGNLSLRIRSALCKLIYEKSLRIDKSSELNYRQAINLISSDLDQLSLNLAQLIWILSGPLECILLTAYLISSLGYIAATLSVLMSSALAIHRGYLNFQMRHHSRGASRISDERVSLINEALSAIRILRMYSWTSSMGDKIEQARGRELAQRSYKAALDSLDTAMFFTSCPAIALITLTLAHYLTGLQLTQAIVSQVFMITLVHRRTLSRYFPQGVLSWISLGIVFDRIGAYLEAPELTFSGSIQGDIRSSGEERPEVATNGKPAADDGMCWPILRVPHERPIGDEQQVKPTVVLNQATASWRASEQVCLDGISFAALPGELLMVAGKVGVGKSSLLQAILGELPLSSGSIERRGKLAYAAQESWAFSGTVRDNILFGDPLDTPRYLEVLRVCSLLPDLASFPALDQTQIGERGVTLSGGQKARITLARCLYQRASVYLLDDPLSAVDPHVARHIFKQALKGFLAGETIILVTHQVQFLRLADKVLLLHRNEALPKGARGQFGTLEQLAKLDSQAQVEFSPASSRPATNDHDDEHDEGDFNPFNRFDEQSVLARIESQLEDAAGSSSSPAISLKDGQEMRDISERIHQSTAKSAMSFYLKNSARLSELYLFMADNLAIRFLFTGIPIWLNMWSGANDPANTKAEQLIGITFIRSITIDQAFLIAGTFWLALLIASALRGFQWYLISMRGARRIHKRLMNSVLWAKMRFFDLTPPGELINRISADVSYLDTSHLRYMDELSMQAISTLYMLLTVVVSQFWMVGPVIGVCLIAYAIFFLFIKLIQVVKHLEGYRRSALYTHVSLTLDGLSTIRASEKEQMFSGMFNEIQDKHMSLLFLELSLRRLIINWLDWILQSLFVVLVVIDVVDTMNGYGMYAFVGLNLIMQITRQGTAMFTQFVELYTRIQSLNRIQGYCQLEPEEDCKGSALSPAAQLNQLSSIGRTELDSDDGRSKSLANFQHGRVEFVGVSLKYRRLGEIVLRNINFKLEPGEKVGIVGRTGAGKSSLIAALFRLYHFEGFVFIDGQDTKQLDLDSLRRSISIIPQDPVLFSGSLRLNLDPLDQYSDSQLWRALESVQLSRLVTGNRKSLDMDVNEGGTNFSVGQRQLICLARAILRGNRLLVLDEATANVDPETDSLIQRALRTEFADCTVITVAHRLSTIIDSSRIMVIDKGQLCEFASPLRLLEMNGLFAEMVASSGGSQADELRAKIIVNQ